MRKKNIVLWLGALMICVLSSFSIAKHRVAIIFIGDSITESGALKNPNTESAPARAADYLRESKNIDVLDFSNQGHSGATTLDFLSGSGYYERIVSAAKNILQKENNATLLFSIMLGTNDSAIKGTHGAPVSPGDYAANIQSIIDHLHAQFPTGKFILHFPLWYSANTYNSAMYLQEGQDRIKKYFTEIDQLVVDYGKKYPGMVYAGDKKGYAYFEKSHLTTMFPQQGQQGIFYLHPNVMGSQALGELWGKAIERIVKKMK